LSWLTRKNIVQIDGHPGFDYSQFHFYPPNLPSVVFHSFVSVFHTFFSLKNDFFREKHNVCVCVVVVVVVVDVATVKLVCDMGLADIFYYIR